MTYSGWSRKTFLVFNCAALGLLSLLCVLPLLHVLAVSFSSSSAASGGLVRLWPVGFNTSSYAYVWSSDRFLRSVGITLQRVVIGGALTMLLTVITAYPLAKESSRFKSRTYYSWFFVLTILFGGGLIPLYMVIRATGLMDTIWALVLPNAVAVFSVILLLNFFRGIPRELEEAAFIDGAGHLSTLFRVYAPLSLPALATITLLTIVGHWNSWFDGLIFMNKPEHYPLQSYLQTVIIQQDFTQMTEQDYKTMQQISDRTIKSAQIFLGALPILLFYPFLQKYFISGIVMGSVKE